MRLKSEKKTHKTLGRVFACICLASFVALVIVAAVTGFVDSNYLIAGAVMLAAVAVIFALLTWAGRGKRLVVGIVLEIIFSIIAIIACIVIGVSGQTLGQMTGRESQTIQVGVFVRVEDEPTYDLTDPANVYGILSGLDRENTDLALDEFETKYGFYPQTAEYNSPAALADSLLASWEDNAIILNTAYLQLLEESEGYEDIMDRIVQIETFNIEVSTANSSDDTYIDKTAFTVYISGIDSREGLQASSLSDVNIIAAVNTETHQVLLLTTPRDYYIPLSISNGEKDKLTHAGIYGVNVSMDTLADLYHVPMDYYFRIDFDGFKGIVDALGGITVYSDYTFMSQNVEGFYFVEGENEMDGEAALAFCRERYSFPDGDLQRGRNQVAVLDGIIQKASSPAILGGYMDILNSMSDHFETSIPYDLITSIVRDVERTGVGEWNIVNASVGGAGAMEVTYTQQVEASVVIPYDDSVEEATQLLVDVLNGEIITQPDPETLGSEYG